MCVGNVSVKSVEGGTDELVGQDTTVQSSSSIYIEEASDTSFNVTPSGSQTTRWL
jgi:hypothetical protein